ncbi:hypothetical protein [Williamwhitmania taraxaci]|uniref:AhpC/TSA family protein n=1 Tax=Williamwhitmania taraxaci TaxID=1640674 RepID=A0A1G6U7Q2_9BACT|nr:hypothetical protein [Williamwhitmania taraxaci]SDD36637.1 hypothetical protein SAMN05216323_11551 [Williamwhitmania taraxaci]
MHNSLKKTIITITIAVVVIMLGLLVFDITKKVSKQSVFAEIKTLHVKTLDSTNVTLALNQPDTTLIMIFNSECDICKIELGKMLIDYPLLEKYRICLLSRQNISVLKQFQIKQNLDNYPSIELFKIDERLTEEPFNTAPNPSVFIYDKNGKAIFQRKGYTNISELINLIANGKNS